MFEVLVMMILPAVIIAGIIYFQKADWLALPIIVIPAFLILWGFYGLAAWSKTQDTEVWNGQVQSKSRNEVSCSHSYRCMCYYTTDSKGNSEEHCSTCYEHSYDVDWDVDTDLGRWHIQRLDSQGLDEPPRWTSVQVGDPVSEARTFTNYIKGADFSLFYSDPESASAKWKALIPTYPDEAYDYWHIDRVLQVGFKSTDLDNWNAFVQNTLKDIGPQKQVNAVVVMVNSSDTSFAEALNRAWLGGKKNDVIVILGTPHYPAVEWVRVLSWTPNSIFKVELREKLESLGRADPVMVTGIMRAEILSQFHRRHMKDFEYLTREIVPSGPFMWFLWILATLALPIASWFGLVYYGENYARGRY